MRRRAKYLLWLCALVAALPAASSARRTNEPLATSAPQLRQTGTQLELDNGGWFSYSGNVDRYVFRFTRDGQLVQGAASVPKTTPYGSTIEGEYPANPNANVHTLAAGDVGHVFCGDVYAGTHSRYVYADGTVAYDVIEWGHTLARDGSELQPSCLTVNVLPSPIPQPNPPAAAASIEAALGLASTSAWRRANPGEWAKLIRYHQDADARPALATAIGRALVFAVDAYWYSRGR